MNHKFLGIAVVAGLVIAGTAAEARDQIRVVGSSTVFPYSQAAAEQFARKSGQKAPVVESTGTGGGMKIFCQGIGPQHPDLTGASRAMKKSEWELCSKNGVTNISEALIGYDGLTIAVSRKGEALDLTRKQIFQALSAEIPVNGKWVANPNMKWSDIDAKLPDMKIQVFGPPPTSGTRDAFVDLAMHAGCKAFPEAKSLSKADMKSKCSRMRQDGLFIEAGENDNLIVQRLESDATAYGIFGYSFLYENQDKLVGLKVEGVTPTFDTIGDNSYTISRPLYFYVKNDHRNVIAGLQDFVAEYVSEDAMGDGGYFNERGMVPLPEAKRKEVRASLIEAKQMPMF
ncbi:MAG: substrate-binding domain-containing protein [Rhodospirillales bacterium]